MNAKPLIRFTCDWCGAEAETSGEYRVPAEPVAPPGWWPIVLPGGETEVICPGCVAAIRTLRDQRLAPTPEKHREGCSICGYPGDGDCPRHPPKRPESEP